MGEVKRAWFGLPGLADPPTSTDDLPKWNRTSGIKLDPLVANLEQARRDLERAEKAAKQARDAAEHYREVEELAQRELEEALISLGILEREPPKGET